MSVKEEQEQLPWINMYATPTVCQTLGSTKGDSESGLGGKVENSMLIQLVGWSPMRRRRCQEFETPPPGVLGGVPKIRSLSLCTINAAYRVLAQTSKQQNGPGNLSKIFRFVRGCLPIKRQVQGFMVTGGHGHREVWPQSPWPHPERPVAEPLQMCSLLLTRCRKSGSSEVLHSWEKSGCLLCKWVETKPQLRPLPSSPPPKMLEAIQGKGTH